jgi:enoyl-CoA hydratase/carnithine racemase
VSAGAVRLSIEGRVATVLFDRPAARNAMTFAMYDELSQACRAVAAMPGLRVAVFRGAGGSFVAGTDIREFLALGNGRDGVEYERRIEAGIAEIEALPVPTLAIVDGAAMGGGLMIATACDLRIASARSRFGVPIASTVGNCLSIRNVARLERAFGLGATRRMLLLAEALDASEARERGFLLGIAEDDQLLARADAILARLEANAPLSIAATREFIRRLAEGGGAGGEDVIARVYGSRDFREGVSAFLEKRPPRWSGA